MLFYVSITVRIPHGTDPDKVRQLTLQEHARAQELRTTGEVAPRLARRWKMGQRQHF